MKEAESHFSEDEATNEILQLYRRIGQRDSLKSWREEVPADARKAWITSFVEDALRNKVQFNFDVYDDVILAHLADDEKERYEELRDHATVWLRDNKGNTGDGEPDAAALEKMGDFRRFMHSHVKGDLLRDVAARYFSTFDESPEHLAELREKQGKISDSLAETIKVANLTSVEQLRSLRMATENVSSGQNIDSDQIEKIEPEDSADVELGGALLIAGSSAIGPRKKDDASAAHSQKQEVDLTYIPEAMDSDNEEEVEDVVERLKELSFIMDSFNGTEDAGRKAQIRELLADRFPQLASTLRVGEEQGLDVDFRILGIREGDDGLIVPNWKKLVGPHLVSHKFSASSSEDYRFYLDKSVEAALDSE